MQEKHSVKYKEKERSHTFLMKNVYILHLLMFSRWYARRNFNGVLMATARVYGAQTVLGKEGRKSGKEEDAERKQTKKECRRRSP